MAKIRRIGHDHHIPFQSRYHEPASDPELQRTLIQILVLGRDHGLDQELNTRRRSQKPQQQRCTVVAGPQQPQRRRSTSAQKSSSLSGGDVPQHDLDLGSRSRDPAQAPCLVQPIYERRSLRRNDNVQTAGTLTSE